MTVFSTEIVPKDPLWKTDLLAKIIEESGLSGIWLSEHPHNRSSFITASYLLKRVQKIWIGVGVINPYVINPFIIAQIAASLTEIAPNRVNIAIGAGDKTTLESIGIERSKPLDRVRQTVTIIRQILREKRAVIDNMCGRLDFNPRSYTPIYVAAQGPRMLQLAGEIGDGVLVNYSDPEDLRWAHLQVKKGVDKSSRIMDKFDLAAYLTLSIDNDIEKASKTAAPYAAYILCGLPEDLIRDLDINEKVLGEIREAIKKTDWLKLYSILSIDVIKRFVIVCQPSSLREILEEIVGIGYKQIVLGAPLGPRVLYSLREACKTIGELVKLRA
ncbi:MAG: LLM class flavin-dependent oxidoreductase [Candidatus Caldarchaeales archaeon]